MLAECPASDIRARASASEPLTSHTRLYARTPVFDSHAFTEEIVKVSQIGFKCVLRFDASIYYYCHHFCEFINIVFLAALYFSFLSDCVIRCLPFFCYFWSFVNTVTLRRSHFLCSAAAAAAAVVTSFPRRTKNIHRFPFYISSLVFFGKANHQKNEEKKKCLCFYFFLSFLVDVVCYYYCLFFESVKCVSSMGLASRHIFRADNACRCR